MFLQNRNAIIMQINFDKYTNKMNKLAIKQFYENKY